MSEPITMPLDLRGSAPAVAQELLRNKTKCLRQGKSFQMLSDQEPKEQILLLASLGADLTWAYLESGPALWRVRVDRRAVEISNCCSGGACCG